MDLVPRVGREWAVSGIWPPGMLEGGGGGSEESCEPPKNGSWRSIHAADAQDRDGRWRTATPNNVHLARIDHHWDVRGRPRERGSSCLSSAAARSDRLSEAAESSPRRRLYAP